MTIDHSVNSSPSLRVRGTRSSGSSIDCPVLDSGLGSPLASRLRTGRPDDPDRTAAACAKPAASTSSLTSSGLLPTAPTAIGIACLLLSACTETPNNKEDNTADSGDECGTGCVDAPPHADSNVDSNQDSQPDPCTAPGYVPDGWEEFPVPNSTCPVFVPSSREYLPPPLIWEPCPSDTGPLPFECRQAITDTSPSLWPMLGGSKHQHAFVDTQGNVVVQLMMQSYPPGPSDGPLGNIDVLMEMDGVVQQAFWQPDVPGQAHARIAVTGGSVFGGKSTWDFSEYVDELPRWLGTVGGNNTLLRPPVLETGLDSAAKRAMVLAGGNYYLVKDDQMRVFKWDGTVAGQVAEGTSLDGPVSWVGDTLLFENWTQDTGQVLTWTKQDGARLLLDFAGDDKGIVGSAASDGHDLVWFQRGESHCSSGTCSDRWLMTSEFSDNPSNLQPRPVSLFPLKYGEMLLDLPVVGCGHATFKQYCSGEYGYSSLCSEGITRWFIVRLSDGASWEFGSSPMSALGEWMSPVAVTCDEVYVWYHDLDIRPTIRRIALDSLGPPQSHASLCCEQ